MAIAAGLAFYLDAATLMSVAIALPIWRDAYQLGPWQVGVISAGLTFAVAAGSLIGGWLGDRFGRGLIFGYDLVLFVLGTVVILMAPSGTVLTVGVVVVGLAAGADVPTALAMIADHAPTHARGRLTAVTQIMWTGAVLASFALGFAVSTLGLTGARILVAHLVVLSVFTLVLRLLLVLPRVSEADDDPDDDGARTSPRGTSVSLSRLMAPGVGGPVVLTGLFLLCWNTASATLGSYGVYIFVTVTELSQAEATGLVLSTFPIALVMSVIFLRLADTRWRDRLSIVAMMVQVAAFAAGAVTGGTVVAGVVVLLILYSLSNVFGGEAAYKVWSQLLLPADLRATAIGLTFAVARGTAAAFLLVVPLLVQQAPDLLLWVLVACVMMSGLVGTSIVRRPAFQPLLRADTSVADS
jgi:inositol transporter-like SP family MFS transporter